MFSGLVAARAEVRWLRPRGSGAEIEVADGLAGEPLMTGESIAVSGACLTVSAVTPAGFRAEVSAETLHRTTLGRLRAGSAVNLERSLRLADRLGGHLVLGHVDATVAVLVVREQPPFRTLRFALPSVLACEVAEKGSVAVDGVSLTVSAVGEGSFEVAVIPATLAATTLGSLRSGDQVNLETDVLAKYVRRALERGGGRLEALLGGLERAPD